MDSPIVSRPGGCNGVDARMMSQFSRRLVQYYMALRLSAGAAMLFLPFETPEPRTPIVRAAETTGPAGFDRREVIVHSGKINVVTLPVGLERAPDQPPIWLN
jgi:hypothetical protein